MQGQVRYKRCIHTKIMEAQRSMVYVKNPNYYDADNVTVDEMNVMLTSDDVSAYTAYQNGRP